MDHLLPSRGTSTTRARAGRPRAVLLGALVLLVAVVAGCATVRAFADVDTALKDEGFTSTQVNVAPGDPVALTVSADAPPGDSPEEAQTNAAEVVWTTFPRRFEEVRITIDGDGRTVTRAQLQEQFGDRPGGLDDQGELADDIDGLAVSVIIGVLLTGLVIVVITALTVLLVVRRRRRNADLAPPGRHQPWAPPPAGGPAGMPVAPPSGWGDPQLGATPPPTSTGPPGPGVDPHATGPPTTDPPGPPPAQGVPSSSAPPPRAPTSAPVRTLSHREARADARRRGRPARGPRPPDTQIPKGWG